MKLIREYDFAGSHYGLVAFDDGSKVEIKHRDPLAKAGEMLAAGAFATRAVEQERKTLVEFSDDELIREVEKRNIKQVVRGVVVA